jgi:glutamate racemase
MPDVEVVHLVDEGLPFLYSEQSRERIIRRLRLLASLAEESRVEVVMLTCTAFGRLVEEVKVVVNIPVLAVLEIVADEAMGLSGHIGVLATHPGTLFSASEVIREQASLEGKKVTVKTLLCERAFEAIRHEDWATHDNIVLQYLNELMEDVEVVVIPQPSVERVLSQVPKAERKVPILSSAHLSVQRLKEKLSNVTPSVDR